MNAKAEKFQEYLQEKNITCFQVDELPEDRLNTVIFRSTIAVEGQELPTLVILDDSIYSIIRVRVVGSALKEGNETELIKAINKLNAQYKVFKYYFAEDGALIMDCCLSGKPDELDGDLVYTILDVIIKHLEAEYKNIMKLVWA